MDSCKVCHQVDRRRRFFYALFFLSVIASALAVVAVMCEKIGHAYAAIHWICLLYKLPLFGFNLEGLKNVAMTVGLTGILFAWLLQVIGDKECGVELDELFRNQFCGYVWQVFFFIVAMVLCIYYSSFSHGEWGSPAVFTSITMTCGICNMWIMCTCFLFSTTTRRMIAFRYLEGKLKESWSERELDLWAKQLDTCIGRGEAEPVKAYFNVIHQKLLKEKGEKIKCVEQCCRSMEITWAQVDHGQWDSYLPYVLAYRDIAGELMMSVFMLQAGRAQENNAERFEAVLHCVECGTAGETQPPASILALYLAFICVHQNASSEAPVHHIYDQLYRIKWRKLVLSPPQMTYYKNLLDTMILCYGKAYTYDSSDFAVRCSLEKLMPQYINLLEQMSSTAEAVSKYRQKGDD